MRMLVRRFSSRSKALVNSSFHYQSRLLTAAATTPPPPPPQGGVNPDHLLQVCTILFQQQASPDSKLHKKLSSLPFPHLSHEFFLQVCNSFPSSWRPVHRFFLYWQLQQQQHSDNCFTHTSISFNKMLDVVGKSENIELFWEILHEMGRSGGGLVNDKTFVIAIKTLASARELRKCVEVFHLMDGFGYGYSLERLNKVVECLCKGGKLVEEAKFLVFKLKEWVRPCGVTYGWLVKGFCDVGDMVEASKVWNLMVDEALEPEVEAFEKMIETFFKRNEDAEAMKVFQAMRVRKMSDLGLSSYRIVIDWMCKKGKIALAKMLFDEMCERGIEPDNLTLGSLVYGLLARGRVNEAYKIVEKIQKPDISVYHGMIKGLLRLRRASAATEVFREMIVRGCEPIMHTYVMLLQGHLGKRGRKGPDPLVNFDVIFVGGLVKAGKSLEASKFVERMENRGVEVPKFDYNKFLHYYSSEEGAVMFQEVANRLREVGSIDLADILQRYGEKMATRDRRRNRAVEP